MGCSGNPQVLTPHLDAMAEGGVRFTNAVSTCPICTPYRASLLTGRYPLSNGMILNDVRLPVTETSIAHVLGGAGYSTAYIGKWHLDGPYRGSFTPPGPRRQGFDYWAASNCTHSYLNSHYYRDTPEPIWIEGYDADHFTDLTIDFMRERASNGPFAAFLSWGPPHCPYLELPDAYRIYNPEALQPRPNSTRPQLDRLAGYYAHITALDRNIDRLQAALAELGIAEGTIFVFTSDHGDMLGSHGHNYKQRPWEESISVPCIASHPGVLPEGLVTDTLLNVPDLMPSLLSLCGVPSPGTVEGQDLSCAFRGEDGPEPQSAFISNPCPFIEDIPEWRGVRSKRYTYARTLRGPWLLYDNVADPYQLNNLVDDPAHAATRSALDTDLDSWLARLGDDFQPREVYWERFGYTVDTSGAIPCFGEVGLHDPA
jgi:arylsulfatase A-like enzyme